MKDKISVAIVTNHMIITGIGTVIMNYCKVLNPSEFKLTIIAGSPIDDLYIKECKDYGVEIIELPSKHDATLSHYWKLFKTLSGKKYDIVHIHGNSSIMAIELLIAKMRGIKVRIAHSHNSKCLNMEIQKIMNPLFKRLYTKGLACSTLAGDWLFGKDKFDVLPNSFDTERFKYNSSTRDEIRKELNIESRFVVGHTGRFNSQKNQEYLLKVFEELSKEYNNVTLLLVGSGENFENISELKQKSKYSDNIILYGESKEPEKLYNAMDLFAFPSIYEGLGIVMLEAQINGLPCVASDRVPIEAKISENVSFLGIDESDTANWCKKISEYINNNISATRDTAWNKNQEGIKSYDIVNSANVLSDIYKNLL